MVPPVANGERSPAPTANEEETPVEAMEVGDVVALEKPDEMESKDDDKAVDPAEAWATSPEPDDEVEEDPDEDVEEEEKDDEAEDGVDEDLEEEEEDDKAEEDQDEDLEEEEQDEDNKREENEEAIDEETVMEPLDALMPGEVQEEKNVSEETQDEEDDEEPSEVGKESAEVDGEDPEETKKVSEDGAKGLVHETAVDDVDNKTEGEHGKHGEKNKDEVADILSDSDDAGGSRGDMQNSELAGGLELLVDELPKNCVEGDIAMVFSECTDIKSVRIIRNSSTEKSKDIAFVCFASTEAADKALTEFKKGIEVKGIKVRVSACQHSKTLFLGNIYKSSTKDQVLSALNKVGIPQCKLTLPSNKNGKNRGYCFLKFGSHYYARAAFCRLMKSDVNFGIGGSVTVSFHRKASKPSDDLMEAKRVYLEHVPHYWNEDKIKECCEGYGKILNVDLFQISKNEKSETFSFVEFSSSSNALACVEGINNSKIVDGSIKLSACLARPKNGATSEGATSKKENDHTEKVCVENKSLQKLPKGNKGKVTSQVKEVVVKKNAPSKLLKYNDRKRTSQDTSELQQTSKPSGGERRLGKYKSISVNQIPSKKAKNNCNVLEISNPSKGKRKSGKDVNNYINERPLKKAHNNRNVRRPNRTRGTEQTREPQYSRACHSLGESSRSKAYSSDLEPHAGYIPPADKVHRTRAYDQQRIRRHDIRPIGVHLYDRETAPPPPRSTFSGYTSHAHYETGYESMYSTPPTSESYYPRRGPFISRRGDY